MHEANYWRNGMKYDKVKCNTREKAKEYNSKLSVFLSNNGLSTVKLLGFRSKEAQQSNLKIKFFEISIQSRSTEMFLPLLKGNFERENRQSKLNLEFSIN